MESLGSRIREAREKARLSQAELAERVGISQPSIQALEVGKATGTKHLIPLARALGVEAEWLTDGATPPTKGPLPESNVVKFAQIPPPTSGELTVNVLGATEAGEDGSFLWNGEIIDRVPRPPFLSGATSGYALYVAGGSMEPRYHPGEVVFVHPGRPVMIGSYVVVQVRAAEGEPSPRAFLKRLVRRTAKTLYLEQLSPKRQIEVPAQDVLSIHRVVGSGDG